MDALYIDRHSQETLDWLRGLVGDDEYQKVICAKLVERDDIAPSTLVRVSVDLLVDRKDAPAPCKDTHADG